MQGNAIARQVIVAASWGERLYKYALGISDGADYIQRQGCAAPGQRGSVRE